MYCHDCIISCMLHFITKIIFKTTDFFTLLSKTGAEATCSPIAVNFERQDRLIMIQAYQ